MSGHTDPIPAGLLEANLGAFKALRAKLAAQAIEAGTGETPKEVRSEGRKRGPKGAPKGDD